MPLSLGTSCSFVNNFVACYCCKFLPLVESSWDLVGEAVISEVEAEALAQGEEGEEGEEGVVEEADEDEEEDSHSVDMDRHGGLMVTVWQRRMSKFVRFGI